MKEIILKFFKKIKEKYNINLAFEYDAHDDYYYIWHNASKELTSNDEFCDYVGENIVEFFSKNGIYNLGLGYDPRKIDKTWTYLDFKIDTLTKTVDSKPLCNYNISNNGFRNPHNINLYRNLNELISCNIYNEIIQDKFNMVDTYEGLNSFDEDVCNLKEAA